MKQNLLIPAFLLAALALPASAELPHPDGFARAVKFRVSGYSGSSALENFPVLVPLSEAGIDGFHYSDFNFPGREGTDLCFVATDGTPLPYDVDTWDSSGTSLVWVRLPSLQNDAEFVMCYRSSKSGKTVCADSAFMDYTGVWHLGEPGDGEQTIKDSTANGLDGTSSSKSFAQPGMVGGAREITDTYGKEFGSILVDLGGTGSAKRSAVDALGADFAVSFWMKNRASDAQWQYLVSRKATDASTAWGLQTQDGGTQIRLFSTGGDNGRKQTATLPGLASGWHKVDAVYKYASKGNSAKFDFYWDGVPVNTNSALAAKALQGADHLAIGGHTSGSAARSFNGDMDEVRLRAAFVPTEDWVKADYDQVAVAPLVGAVGSVETFAELPKPVAAFSVPDVGAAFVQFAGSISTCGGDATACSVKAKVWKASASEPSSWTTLATGVAEGGSFSAFVTGLTPETAYRYAIKAANNLSSPYDSDVATGAFTTSGAGVPGEGGSLLRDGDTFVHTFLVNARGKGTWTFTPPSYVSSVEALVVAGGGAGGYYAGGGGGAGGLVHRDALAVTGGATYDVEVGAGGAAAESAEDYGGNGGDSSISLSGATLLSATGGGAGGNGALDDQTATRAGLPGGSGGGSSWATYAAGAGTDGQGSAGGQPADDATTQNHGGGGGGAAAAGGGVPRATGSQSSGSGGNGLAFAISGETRHYAGGGGGGGVYSFYKGGYGGGGSGGKGGGGKGGQRAGDDGSELAESGAPGTGGGGGGGSTYEADGATFYKGGDGGSGVVVVRYPAQGSGAGMSAPVVTLSGAAYDADTATASVSFRVDWAGAGRDRADVAIAWGYSRNALAHTNAVATAAIGRGTGSFPLADNGRNVYLRAVATNAGGTGVSQEIEKLALGPEEEPSTMILLLP